MREIELQEKKKRSFKEYLAKNGDKIFKSALKVSLVLFITVLLAFYSSTNGGVFVLEKSIVTFWFTITIYHCSLFLGVIFTYYFLSFRRYQFQGWQYLVFLAIFIYYLLLRFDVFESEWRFIDLFWKVKVLDPFALMSLIIFGIVFYRSRDKDVKKEPTIFLEDNPLDSEGDKANYKNLLEQINPILYTDKYEKSFSVAIVGAWGSGKSSFIKALTKNIEDHNKGNLLNVEKQVIHFNFSPFLNHDENSIIKEFFTKLSHVLGKRSGKLSNQLIAYSKKLTNLAKEGDLLSFLTPVQSELFNQSAHELYESISDTIKSLNVKIVITIDDLDRLSGKEILEVLKLIRNTSNFPNTVFFVALDKDYIIKTINLEKSKATEYLDKFFQLELTVSKPIGKDIIHFLCGSLARSLVRIEVNSSNLEVITRVIYKLDTLKYFILNHRDAKRFHNQFLIDFQLINSNVNVFEIRVRDIINLTLLKIFYPNVFNNILINNEYYFYSKNQTIEAVPLVNTNLASFYGEPMKAIVTTYFDCSENKYETPTNVKLDLRTSYLLIWLFGWHKEDNESYSVKKEELLKYYFSRTISDDVLSNSEYQSILESGEKMSVIIGQVAYDQGRLRFLMERLKVKQNINTGTLIKIKLNVLSRLDVLVGDTYYPKNDIVDLGIKSVGDLNSISKDFDSLKRDYIPGFEKALSEMLQNKLLDFEKKSMIIGNITNNWYLKGVGGLDLNQSLKNEIELVIKKGSESIINSNEDIFGKLERSHKELGQKYGFRDVMYNSFKENFNKLDLLDFCIDIMFYNDKEDTRVIYSSFVLSFIGGLKNLIELVRAHSSFKLEEPHFKELLDFLELNNLFDDEDFKGLRYYFDYFPFIDVDKSNFGEVIFKVHLDYLKTSSIGFIPSGSEFDGEELFGVEESSKSFYLRVSINDNYKDNFVFLQKFIKQKLTDNGFKAIEVLDKGTWLLLDEGGNLLVSIISEQKRLSQER